MRWAIGTIVVQTALFWLLAWLPGFTLGGPGGAVAGAPALPLVLALGPAWPVLDRGTARFHPLRCPLLTFALTGAVLLLVGQADVNLFAVAAVGTGIRVSLGLTVGTACVGALVALDGDRGDDRVVVHPPRRTSAAVPTAAEPGVLRRTNGFGNAPDIPLNSVSDPATGAVAAFEERAGCHGGLGGMRTPPFVRFPADLAAPDEPIVGAAAFHPVLKGWRTASSGTHAAALRETAAINV